MAGYRPGTPEDRAGKGTSVTSARRSRQLERERRLRRTLAEQQHRQRRAQLWRRGGAGAAVVLVLAAGGAAVALNVGGPSHARASLRAKTATSPSPAASAAASAAAKGTPVCDYVPARHTPGGRFVGLPPDTKATGHPVATLVTNRGTIVMDMLAAQAPCTVNAIDFLAAKGYYNHTPCHRLTTGTGLYVLQCGDPTGTGSGGPGFTLPDENLTGATYPAGTVAMANTGQPHTGGSQFFLVYRNSTLPPQYTPFARIVSGLAVLDRIAAAGATPAGDGRPKLAVEIDSFRVTG